MEQENKPKEDKIGLFGHCSGSDILPITISNLVLENFDITGDHYVGSLIGWGTNIITHNVKIKNPKISARDVSGGAIGTAAGINVNLEIEFFTPKLRAELGEVYSLLSLYTYLTFLYLFTISFVLSVDPPSITIISYFDLSKS